MPRAEKINPKYSAWYGLTHRTHKTNECLWSLSQLGAWLKCGPSWTVVFPLNSHAYPAMLLPMGIPTLPLNGFFFTARRKNSEGFHVEFSVGGRTVVFPLLLEKGQSIFPPWHCVADGTFFPGHLSSVSAEALSPSPAWHQHLAAAGHPNFTSLKEQTCAETAPFPSALSSFQTWQPVAWAFPPSVAGEIRELRFCVGRGGAGVRGHQRRGVLLLHGREHCGGQRIRDRPAARQPLPRHLLTKVSLWSRRSRY